MSTTITIRSRCHEYAGEWEGEQVRVMSNCHLHDGGWIPEKGSPASLASVSIALADNRPGATEPGTRPSEQAKERAASEAVIHHRGKAARIHWRQGSCVYRHEEFRPSKTPPAMLDGGRFNTLLSRGDARLCRTCRLEFLKS